MLIYAVTCAVNGKQYVGLTRRTLKKRWQQHVTAALRQDCQHLLHRAIRKHGLEQFSVRELETVPAAENIGDREKCWVAKLGTFGSGYNLTSGGEGGYELAESVKETLRVKSKQRLQTEEGRQALQKLLDSAHTPEAREKVAAACRERYKTPEGKDALARAIQAAQHPDAVAKRGRKLAKFLTSPEGKLYHERLIAQSNSPEARQAKSGGMRRYMNTEAGRAQSAKYSKIGAAAWVAKYSKPVRIEGVDFPHVVAAANALGVPQKTLGFRLKQGWTGYRYLDKCGSTIEPASLHVPQKKGVMVEGREFSTLSAAAKFLGCSIHCLRSCGGGRTRKPRLQGRSFSRLGRCWRMTL